MTTNNFVLSRVTTTFNESSTCSSIRRSQRLATKKTIDFTRYFRTNRRSKSAPVSSAPRLILSRITVSGCRPNDTHDVFSTPLPNRDYSLKTAKTDSKHALINKHKHQRSTRQLCNTRKIPGSTYNNDILFGDQTPSSQNFLPYRICTQEDNGDDYYATMSNEMPKQNNLTITDLISISERIGSKKCTKKALTAAAFDTVGRNLKNHEVEDAMRTINELGLNNNASSSSKRAKPNEKKKNESFIPSSVSWSREVTPSPQENNLILSTPRTAKYARRITRLYSCSSKGYKARSIFMSPDSISYKARLEKITKNIDRQLMSAKEVRRKNTTILTSDDDDEL